MKQTNGFHQQNSYHQPPVAIVSILVAAIMILSMALLPLGTASASPYYLNSLRAQGMGNAYTAVSNDRYAPFYNPAGLTYLREGSTITLLDGSYGEIGNLANDAYGDYQKVKPLIESEGDQLDQADRARELINNRSTYRYYKINIIPLAYTRRNFAMGVYGVANAYAIYGGDFIDIAVPSSIEDITSIDDLLDLLSFDPAKAPVGIAYTESGAGVYTAISKDLSVGVGRLSYGGNLRVGSQFTGLGSLNLDLKLNQVRSDTAIKAVTDLGLLYALSPSSSERTSYRVGVSYNNLFLAETAVKQTKGEKPFPSNSYLTPTVLNMGGAMIVPLGGATSKSSVTVAVDVPDVLDNRHIADYRIGNQMINRLNYGVEADLGGHLAVRTGLSEGYGTLGLGVKIPAIRVDYAYYVETPPAPVTVFVGEDKGSLTLFSRRGAVRKHSVNVGFEF